jgi:hypothetical protein
MKRCNMKANTSSWTAIARSHVVFVRVDLCRSDVQIKYGEQNGVQQLLCDNEPQMKSTLESVEGGVIYSAINAVQFRCTSLRTAMWTHRAVSLKRYCTWLWSDTTSGSQTVLHLTLKKYYFRLSSNTSLTLKQCCFWLSSSTASDCQQHCFWLSSSAASDPQAILPPAVKQYCFWLSSDTTSGFKATLLWFSTNTAADFQAFWLSDAQTILLLILKHSCFWLKQYCIWLKKCCFWLSSNTASDLFSGCNAVETRQKCRLSWRDVILSLSATPANNKMSHRRFPSYPADALFTIHEKFQHYEFRHWYFLTYINFSRSETHMRNCYV